MKDPGSGISGDQGLRISDEGSYEYGKILDP